MLRSLLVTPTGLASKTKKKKKKAKRAQQQETRLQADEEDASSSSSSSAVDLESVTASWALPPPPLSPGLSWASQPPNEAPSLSLYENAEDSYRISPQVMLDLTSPRSCASDPRWAGGDGEEDVADSDSEEEDVVSKTLDAVSTVATLANAAVARTTKLLFDSLDERDTDDMPKYPIVRYLLESQPASDSPAQQQSYDDALTLTSFAGEFVAMLQSGFRVWSVSGERTLAVLTLARDCTTLSWLGLKRRLSDARVSYDGDDDDDDAAPDSFSLTFAPLSERQAGAAPRETHRFQARNDATARLLVDGFRLLVDESLYEFFHAANDFRVPRAAASRAHPPPNLGGLETPTAAGATQHGTNAAAAAAAAPKHTKKPPPLLVTKQLGRSSSSSHHADKPPPSSSSSSSSSKQHATKILPNNFTAPNVSS